MKKQTQLTTSELMDMIAANLRELNGMSLSDKNLKNAINRSRVTSIGAKTAIQIALYDYKSNAASTVLPIKNKLQKRINKSQTRLL